MTLVRQNPPAPPEPVAPSGHPARSPWAVPLGLGVGGLLATIIVIATGIGYDFVGRSPPPLVIMGLTMLIGPQFIIARAAFQRYQHDLRTFEAQLQRETQERERQLATGPYRALPNGGAAMDILASMSLDTMQMIATMSARHGERTVVRAVSRAIREALASLPDSEDPTRPDLMETSDDER